jgi:hypothetical protein
MVARAGVEPAKLSGVRTNTPDALFIPRLSPWWGPGKGERQRNRTVSTVC